MGHYVGGMRQRRGGGGRCGGGGGYQGDKAFCAGVDIRGLKRMSHTLQAERVQKRERQFSDFPEKRSVVIIQTMLSGSPNSISVG